jgi:acyl transferase domain-containing protein
MSNISETQYKALIKAASKKISNMQPVFDRLHEPIAIVGMGCRFPQANNLEEYWKLLSGGKSGIQNRPEFHSYMDPYFDDDLSKNDRIYTKQGGFLDQHPAAFDASFFKISAMEASSMDPQHRLILEIVWEALEDAGIPPSSLSGSNTGVFMGICSNDYAWKLVKQDASKIDIYLGSGNAYSPASGRVSYLLDIHGPSLAIDTACSSSLTSTHVAINSIRMGECDMAIVGGIQRYLSPEYWVNLCKSRILSPDGLCKSFSDEANGYVRGEGCGVIILKRLSQAQADHDKIHAIIPGSATRQDGKTSGLTVPNGASQQAAIKLALKNANLTIDDIDYIEAHGTGTPIGDPIEMNAIGNLFKSRKKDLLVGTVKSNIGHLEGSAGLAGLIKVVLALKNRKIPQNLNFNTPSSKIAWDNMPVKIVTKLTDWDKEGSNPRTAGVSSFGFEGVNTHVILQEYDNDLKVSNEISYIKSHAIIFSAKSEISLRNKIQQHINYLEKNSQVNLHDLAFTNNCKRESYKYKLSIMCSTVDELLLELKKAFEKKYSPNVFSYQKNIHSNNKGVALLFTGQGSQYVNMGKELYVNNMLFHQTMNKCNEIILDSNLMNESILDVIYNTNNLENQRRLTSTKYAQPALFILEYSLFILLQELGIEPNVVLGHSVGEYVAACVAGILSLEDALTLIVNRGKLMQSLPENGMMAMININEATARQATQNEPLVSIAAINSENSVVLSGDAIAVKKLLALLTKERGVNAIPLQTSHPFHSPLMKPILDDFREVAAKISYKNPKIPFISNVTGEQMEGSIGPDYWCQHLYQPVKFYQSILNIKKYSNTLLEVGPDAVLIGMSKSCISDHYNVISSVLHKHKNNYCSLLSSLAQAYSNDINIKWENIYQGYVPSDISLPTYPWDRKHHWVD